MDITISVDDRRPVQRAVNELETRLGRVITYEDPAWQDPSEAVNVASEIRRSGDGQAPVLVPRGGKIDLTLGIQPDAPASVHKALEAIVEASARAGNPGSFRIEQVGDLFHVIPARAPLLDALINVEGADRSALELVEAVIGAAARARGASATLGTVPVNLLQQTRMNLSAANESARSVLRRLLGRLREHVSWNFLYDPGSRQYVLNLHVMPAR